VAETASGRVALFSIHPDYANALLDGTKRVEFRRTPLPADVTRVVIYATSPVQRILGYFEVAGVDQTPPSKAWKDYRAVGGIEKSAFDRYYEGAASAFVIQARNPVRLPTPLRLCELSDSLRPPQSFLYLREDVQVRMEALTGAPSLRLHPHLPSVPDLVRRVSRRVLVGVTD
jgi:predicted transcriptional regulator